MCWNNSGSFRTIAVCLHIVQDAHAEALVQIKALFLELLLHSAGMRALCTVAFCHCREDGLSVVSSQLSLLFDGCKQSTALHQLWTSIGGPRVPLCVYVSMVAQAQLTTTIVTRAQSCGSQSVKVYYSTVL